MLTKRAVKRSHDALDTSTLNLPEVALAAVISYKTQKEVTDFINFMLKALERNTEWLNRIVRQQNHFKCVVMAGAGPNRFQIQETVYPCDDEDDIRLKVKLTQSDDYDKIALAAVLKLRNANIDSMMKYIKTRMFENPDLKGDLRTGKEMGISFALLSPVNDKQFRVMERIVIGSNLTNVEDNKKRHKPEDKSIDQYRKIIPKSRTTARQ